MNFFLCLPIESFVHMNIRIKNTNYLYDYNNEIIKIRKGFIGQQRILKPLLLQLKAKINYFKY